MSLGLFQTRLKKCLEKVMDQFARYLSFLHANGRIKRSEELMRKTRINWILQQNWHYRYFTIYITIVVQSYRRREEERNSGLYFKMHYFEISKIGLVWAFKYLLVSRKAVKNVFFLDTFPRTLDMIVMGNFICHFCVRNYINKLVDVNKFRDFSLRNR